LLWGIGRLIFQIPVQNLSENLDLIYLRIRYRARRIIAQFPEPSFYRIFREEMRCSAGMFETDPIISKIRHKVAENLQGNMGHGQKHAALVTIDAGALMLIEGKRAGYSDNFIRRQMLLVQCAGMLHDTKRKENDHAIRGAEYARVLLKEFPFFPSEIEDVACAIRNHEAFKALVDINTTEGALISDCLYDADKFRWGPDNFADTVWAMVRFFQTPLPGFLDFYPKGMKLINSIKPTFRSRTGKLYGPEFIDIGLDIGKEVFNMIHADFSYYLEK
jgi:hypothetical protein